MTAITDPVPSLPDGEGAASNPYVKITPKAQTVGQGPRAPHLEDWLEVPEYPGHRVRVWINFPNRLLAELRSDEEARAIAALCELVLEHNGWLAEDGTPYPPASDPAFWQAIPRHQSAAIFAAINARVTTSPLAPKTNTRSGST